jgi:hypothetical protein
MKTRLLIWALTSLVPVTAQAQTLIQCDSTSASPIIIELAAKKKFDVTLHCINGDFQLEGEACAPNGGFGLSRPTGTGELGSVVMRWQDYIDHVGYNTGVNISKTHIAFWGGFQSGPKWSDRWEFQVNRITGVGVLKSDNGPSQPLKETARYNCGPVSTKF